MDRYTALRSAMQQCGNDPHAVIGVLEAAGFDVVARNVLRYLSITSQVTRLAVDAHSPLPQFSVGQITDWISKNHGPRPKKGIYNAIAYLSRRGEIEQIGRGCYRCARGGKPTPPTTPKP